MTSERFCFLNNYFILFFGSKSNKKEHKLKKYYTQKYGQTLTSGILTILILFFLACIISNPSKFISKSLEGITAWAFNVLPCVLPFMVFTKLLSALNLMPKLTRPLSPISRALFKTPAISIYTFIMAVLSGYPVGSKMVADLYLQGKISKNDAFKMTSFCSTSGPMFIVGVVGIGMFKSATIGYILFASHIFGAILNGILFRNFRLTSDEKKPETLTSQESHFDLSDIILNSTLSILSVGAIICVFFIIIECLSPIFSLFPHAISCFLEGLCEITKGCLDLSALDNQFLSISLVSFVIGFGGISTILQSLTMLAKLEMPTKLFAFQKITHGLFSCFCTVLLLIFSP